MIISIVVALLLSIGYVYLYLNPIFIGESLDDTDSCQWTGNLCNPIENIDFSEGDNKIIIYTNWEEVRFLPNGVKQRPLLYCTDNEVIQRVQKHFEFERISDDCVGTTAFDSRICFFIFYEMVFQSLMMIDESITIHFEQTGWVFSTTYEALKHDFAKFKPMYFPIVVF